MLKSIHLQPLSNNFKKCSFAVLKRHLVKIVKNFFFQIRPSFESRTFKYSNKLTIKHFIKDFKEIIFFNSYD